MRARSPIPFIRASTTSSTSRTCLGSTLTSRNSQESREAAKRTQRRRDDERIGMKGAACNAKRSDGLACRHKQENAMFLVMMVPPPLTARRSPLISSKAFLTPTRLFLGSLFSRRIFVDAPPRGRGQSVLRCLRYREPGALPQFRRFSPLTAGARDPSEFLTRAGDPLAGCCHARARALRVLQRRAFLALCHVTPP